MKSKIEKYTTIFLGLLLLVAGLYLILISLDWLRTLAVLVSVRRV